MGMHDHEKMPEWARRIDAAGPRRWHRDRDYRNLRSEFVSSAVFNLIALFVLYKIPDWHLDFINGKYPAIYPILMFSCVVQIVGNLIRLLLFSRATSYFTGIFMEAASFLAMICFYYLYPLDFSNSHGLSWIDIVLPWFLIIGMIVSALKVLSNAWKLIFWR